VTASDSKTDEQLVAALVQGDSTAFALLVKRHGLRYRALAYRLLGAEMLAEDIVQDCFIRLWQRGDAFDARKARFTTWFHRLVVNRSIDHQRRKKPDPLPDGYDAPSSDPLQDQQLMAEAQTRQVRQAVLSLPDRQRDALTLTYFEDRSNRDAAEQLGMKLKAFESLLLRARRLLKEKLEQELGGWHD